MTQVMRIRDALYEVTPVSRILTIAQMVTRIREKQIVVVKHNGSTYDDGSLRTNIQNYLKAALGRGEFERLDNGNYRRLKKHTNLPYASQTAPSAESSPNLSGSRRAMTPNPEVPTRPIVAQATATIGLQNRDELKNVIYVMREQQVRAEIQDCIRAICIAVEHEINERKPEMIQEILEDLAMNNRFAGIVPASLPTAAVPVDEHEEHDEPELAFSHADDTRPRPSIMKIVDSREIRG